MQNLNLGIIGPGKNFNKKFYYLFKKKFKTIYVLRKKKKNFYNHPTFNNFNTFFLKKFDLIYLSTPPIYNTKFLKKCLEKKIDTICEKPLLIKFLNFNKILNQAKKNKMLLIENFSYTCHNVFEDLREIINQRYSSISFVKSVFQYPYLKKNDFRYDKKGFFFDSAVYPISLETFLFNYKVNSQTKLDINYKNKFNGSFNLNCGKFTRNYSWGTGCEYKNNIEIFFKNGESIFVDKIFSKNQNEIIKLIFFKNKKKIEKHYQNINQEKKFLEKIIKNKNMIYFREKVYNQLNQHTLNLKKIYEKIFKI
jgi:predicted dehydrogenase